MICTWISFSQRCFSLTTLVWYCACIYFGTLLNGACYKQIHLGYIILRELTIAAPCVLQEMEHSCFYYHYSGQFRRVGDSPIKAALVLHDANALDEPGICSVTHFSYHTHSYFSND